MHPQCLHVPPHNTFPGYSRPDSALIGEYIYYFYLLPRMEFIWNFEIPVCIWGLGFASIFEERCRLSCGVIFLAIHSTQLTSFFFLLRRFTKKHDSVAHDYSAHDNDACPGAEVGAL